MLKYCLEKWDKNKGLLEKALREGAEWNSCEYKDLVKLVVDCILNEGDERSGWYSEKITVIDDGDYQGTQLYLIPCRTYQPCEYDYLMTYVGYGSCSGCDTLLNIQGFEKEPLTDRQIKDFMHLCKDIVTNMIKPYNGGWRHDDRFEQVTEGEVKNE